MARFTQPEHGNAGRPGSPVNSVRNLQHKLHRQRREEAVRVIGEMIMAWVGR